MKVCTHDLGIVPIAKYYQVSSRKHKKFYVFSSKTDITVFSARRGYLTPWRKIYPGLFLRYRYPLGENTPIAKLCPRTGMVRRDYCITNQRPSRDLDTNERGDHRCYSLL